MQTGKRRFICWKGKGYVYSQCIDLVGEWISAYCEKGSDLMKVSILAAIFQLWYLLNLMDIQELKHLHGKVSVLLGSQLYQQLQGGRLNQEKLWHILSFLNDGWGITIPKIQGLTLDKVVVELGKKDFSAGLSFVAISWVKTLQGLAFCTHFDYSYFESQATESMLMLNRYIYNEHHNQLGSNRFSIWPMPL